VTSDQREVALDAPSGQTGYFSTAGDYLFVEGLTQEGETVAFWCYPFSKQNLEKLQRIVDELSG